MNKDISVFNITGGGGGGEGWGMGVNMPPPPTISKTVVSNSPYRACAFQEDVNHILKNKDIYNFYFYLFSSFH